MKNETKEAFLKFNPELQKELIELHPELQEVLDEQKNKKRFPKWLDPAALVNKQTSWKDQILSVLDIYQVLDFYGFKTDRYGRCACMFHHGKDKNLSCYNRTKYQCFVCGARGDLISFVMDYFAISFQDALIKLDTDFNLGITGKELTLEAASRHKKAATVMQKLRAEHEEFKKCYLVQVDIFRYLNKAIKKYAPTDPDQDSDDWHPVFIYASQNRGRLEWWLDEYQGIYSDIGLYQKFKQEGRLPEWN